MIPRKNLDIAQCHELKEIGGRIWENKAPRRGEVSRGCGLEGNE